MDNQNLIKAALMFGGGFALFALLRPKDPAVSGAAKKSFDDNGRTYNIYQFLLKSIEHTDDLFNILVQIKTTFLEREKMIFDLNKKLEQEKRELEENINKKINSLRGVQQNKKTKNEIVEKIEEVEELKNMSLPIDNTISISEIMTNYNK